MNLNEMLQERAKIHDQLKDIQNKYNDLPLEGADKETYCNLENAFDDVTKKIEAAKKQLERERMMGEEPPKEPKAKVEASKLFAKALTGDVRHIQEYRNEMTLGTDASAGFLTAPVEFVNRLIAGLDNEVFMRNICDVVGPIGQAQSLGFPYVATDASDVTWTTEVAQAAEETTLLFGRREFKPNRLAKRIKISETLVRHAPNPDQTILSRMLYKIAMAQESAYMIGDGSSKPLGVFIANDSGINTDRDVSTGNTDTTVTFDGLQEAKYSVKGQYQRQASWIMHRDLCKMLAKIKDGEGQYVWQGSVVQGQPDMLLGAPVYMSEYAPNTYTSGLYAAVYGAFNPGYMICDSDGLYIKVLNELYSEYNEIGYIINYFGDGAPVLPEAFARVKLA